MTPPTPNQSSGTLKDIFDRIESREWDWFHKRKDYSFFGVTDDVRGEMLTIDELGVDYFYSLADLLANKSWCQAVWGIGLYIDPADVNTSDEEILKQKSFELWTAASENAFVILQREGPQPCINYILKTML